MLFEVRECVTQVGGQGLASREVVYGLRDPPAGPAGELTVERRLDAGSTVNRDRREFPSALGREDVGVEHCRDDVIGSRPFVAATPAEPERPQVLGRLDERLAAGMDLEVAGLDVLRW